MSESLFFVLAAISTLASLFMVASRSAVNSAMGMIVALVSVAAIYFLLDAPFLGVLQILVYAGAVMVLFLFIIMLLDVDKASRTPRSKGKWATGALVVTALAFAITCAILHGDLSGAAAPATDAGVDGPLPHAIEAKAFGYGLFSKYLLPLQIAGFLLLSAMIGVVSISKKPKALK